MWLATPMANELTRVIFVDQAGAVFQEAALSLLPKVGDSVELPDKQVAGVIDKITWRIPGGMLESNSLIVRLAPNPT